MFFLGKNSGIKQRVILLALLPTLSITLSLGALFTYSRLNDLDQIQVERALAITKQFSSDALSSLNPNNAQAFKQQLANALLEKNDVRAVSIFDMNNKLLFRSGPNIYSYNRLKPKTLPKLSELIEFENSVLIQTPIYPPSDNTPTGLGHPIGWYAIEFSLANTQIKKYQTLLATGLLMIAGIVLNILLALRIGQQITRPMFKISRALNHIREGNLDTRINTNTGGEMRELESGVNAMVASLQRAQRDMQLNIKQSTQDLQETLETIEIQNIELDMARKEALEASRIKSEFLANMSHEIRTPLNGIIGFAKLLLRTPVNDRQLEYLQTINQSSEGLLTIINDVLDFSKIEAGKLTLDKAPFNLRELIEEVLDMLAPSAHEKQLELVTLIYADTPLQLIGDPLRIKQILTNLVNNAIKFTHQGSITIRAMLESEQGGRALIKLSITDTGIGLSPPQQRTLFKAFNQADTSTTRKIGGTGLGLVISKRLAQQMKGEIGLESTQGEGSTFWFSFNLPVNPEAKPCAAELAQFPSIQCLIYEPNELARQSIVHLLNSFEIETLECLSEQQLISLSTAEASPYGLGIISYQPRDLSQEVLQQVMQAPWPKLLISHITHQEELSPLLSSANALLLTKPLGLTKMHKALDKLLMHKLPEPIEAAGDKLKSLRTPRILAVDDNPANLRLIQALLEDMGCKVTLADCGHKAVDYCKQDDFDLIFMDVQMPIMDGVDTTRMIREQEGDKRTPVIALTAHALADEKRQLLVSGLDGYMSKPINEEQLQQLMHKWIGKELSLKRLGAPAVSVANEPLATAPSTEERSALQVVDMQEGLRLANGKAELAQEMIDMLLASLKQEAENIQQAAAMSEHEALLSHVHKLHGATRYCGVPALREACYALESKLKASEDIALSTEEYAQLNCAIEDLWEWQEAQASTELNS